MHANPEPVDVARPTILGKGIIVLFLVGKGGKCLMMWWRQPKPILAPPVGINCRTFGMRVQHRHPRKHVYNLNYQAQITLMPCH